ncbi:MAG: ComEA family DNA-binding protein, partial [Planctomycetota bacterium]|nr:ComEA family DNA-binding protein [Planctomycetota bacterium]
RFQPIVANVVRFVAYVFNRPVLNTPDWAGPGDRGRGSLHWPDSRIDINSAGLAQLDLLPGIGPGLAQRIATDRLANGRFTSVDDLTRVPGIGPRIIERIRPFAVAEAIDLQVSTAEHPPTRR